MKNIINVSSIGDVSFASVADDVNELWINDEKIDESEWVGSGTLIKQINGAVLLITKVADANGVIGIRKNGSRYDLFKYGVSPIIDQIYPIGSIYLSVNNANPSNLFGGTWEQIKDRFLLSAGDTYQGGVIGGEAEHTLTENEMPSHNHKAGHQNNLILTNQGGTQWPPLLISPDGNIAVYNTNTSSTGGGAAHNNMPPYLAVYVWKRTA